MWFHEKSEFFFAFKLNQKIDWFIFLSKLRTQKSEISIYVEAYL